jgi:hypothetical protein
MTQSHVQVAPDSTGKDIDADAVTSTESGNPTVYRQDVVIADPTNYANKAVVSTTGDQAVNPSIFSDLYTLMVQQLVELRRIRMGIQILLNENTTFRQDLPDPGEDLPN